MLYFCVLYFHHKCVNQNSLCKEQKCVLVIVVIVVVVVGGGGSGGSGGGFFSPLATSFDRLIC